VQVHPFVVAIGLSALGSLGGALMASLFLIIGDNLRPRLVPWLISYAVGTLLGAALLGLLPEALEQLPPQAVFGALLGGVGTFFVLEKLVLWRHCHETEDCRLHSSAASLVVIGDAVHTFVDGVVIATAVMTSMPLGLATALAVAAHEIPQEVGDVAILLRAGHSRSKALRLNLLSGLAGIAGAVGMLFFARWLPALLPYVLGFAAGNFLYVAMADLIPSLHRVTADESAFRQVILISAGVATIMML
jgi:zinc and cadmium transporter